MSNLINFSALTADNGAVKTIAELAFTTAWKTGELSTVTNIKTGQKDGAKLDFIDSIDAIGTSGRGCSPTYQAVTPKGFEKSWSMGDYKIALKICADSWRKTVADYALKKGTDLEDMTGTEIIEKILMPLISRAYDEALWRMAWFGDKNAKLQANGGILKAGTDVNLFKMCNGLFNRLAAIAAANPGQLTAIGANSQTTYALQKSTIAGSGVATGIVNDMLANADGRILNNGGKLMMTNAFYQALKADYRNKFNYTIPFDTVSRGVGLSEYEGVQILVFNVWDQMIKTYEDDGTKLNNPYRVVFANPDNLLIGTEDVNLIADMDLWFDKTDRQNYLYAASNIDTLVAEDDLVQIAM